MNLFRVFFLVVPLKQIHLKFSGTGTTFILKLIILIYFEQTKFELFFI